MYALSPSHPAWSAIQSNLIAIYGVEQGPGIGQRLSALLEHPPGRATAPPPTARQLFNLAQRDAILITYPDQVQQAGFPPLQTLADFCDQHLAGLVSGIHLLPFYPSSSDDGFSVVDYRAVDPAFGDWQDVHRLGQNFRLMFDAVINHASAGSRWFQGFLQDDPRYRHYFIVVPPGADLSRVVRPRALPLLTGFDTPSGRKAVWTTFSPDQVDLNYANPQVLLEMVDILLDYVAYGAQFIRLDAIAYLWKEYGTPCIHLPQTHQVIQLLRAVLDLVDPQVMLITETNVPHHDNLSYFGDGYNEAQLVYNFALPPLVLHTLHTGDGTALTRWAANLALPSLQTTFFNFLASHDGIGLNPARGILTDPEIEALVGRTLAHGGLVSYKHNPDGSQSPYELNVNYFDALSDPQGSEPLSLQVDRFMAAQAILLSLVGMPGIYFHSLYGSRGWPLGVTLTGRNRTINRQKCQRAALEVELQDSSSLRSQVYRRYCQLLRTRAASPAFHPCGEQQVLDLHPEVFAVLRTSPASPGEQPQPRQHVLCLQNVTDQPITVPTRKAGFILPNLPGDVNLRPYQTIWMDT